jgi:hypothetical protein
MKRLRAFVLPVLTAGTLVLGASAARADMCFGGPHGPAQQGGGGGDAGSEAGARNDYHPRRMGSAFVFTAVIASASLVARRRKARDVR